MKKKDLELELRCLELAVARMSNENSRLAREYAKLYADLIGRDIKIKKMIDAYPNINWDSAPSTGLDGSEDY
jgi:hypothetical protein